MSQTFSEVVDQLEQRMVDADLFFGHGTDNGFDEAAWLVAFCAGVDLSENDDLPWDEILDGNVLEQVERLVERRISTRKPLAYLIQEAWFSGLRFYIDERAIVPRSHIGEWIPQRFSPWLINDEPEIILDLCTGSGCIAIGTAYAFPEAEVDAVDLSSDALEVAHINVEAHGLEDRVNLIQGDLFSEIEGREYDLIVCNPPYVANALMRELPEEYETEPEMAFTGGEMGLDFIDQLLHRAVEFLNRDGSLIVEAGSAAEQVEKAYPDLAFNWMMSENGESVVFVVDRNTLTEWRDRQGSD